MEIYTDSDHRSMSFKVRGKMSRRNSETHKGLGWMAKQLNKKSLKEAFKLVMSKNGGNSAEQLIGALTSVCEVALPRRNKPRFKKDRHTCKM